jgi:hypothetical protein
MLLAIAWRDEKEIWWHSYETEAETLETAGLRQ